MKRRSETQRCRPRLRVASTAQQISLAPRGVEHGRRVQRNGIERRSVALAALPSDNGKTSSQFARPRLASASATASAPAANLSRSDSSFAASHTAPATSAAVVSAAGAANDANTSCAYAA